MALAERIADPEHIDLNAALEAERTVIAALVADPALHPRIARIVLEEAFTERFHRGVFEALAQDAEGGRMPTAETILDRTSDIALGGVPARTYLGRLMERHVEPAQAEDAARMLARAWAGRTRGGEGSRYAADPYSWAYDQAERLRRGDWTALDALNLAEEIEDLGSEIYERLESAFRIILLHLLKWEYQPDRRSRSCALSIKEHRARAAKVLTRNPGLKGRRDDAIRDAYELARLEAARETNLDEALFPDACPYTFDALMSRPVEWHAE